MSSPAPAAVRTPAVVHTRAELAEALEETRADGGRVALVPTMGALHEGHVSLIREARARDAQAVVVSLFVNPLQFGPDEDLSRYPRTVQTDLELCRNENVDVVFAPPVDELYPGGEPQVTVDPGPLAQLLEGASRPTHFRGVLIVVAKLFGLVRPDLAVFGEKDYQQLVLIRRMVEDLCLGIEIVGAEIVRETDGLAMSSRNRYLAGEHRQMATRMSVALRAGAAAAADGAESAIAAARSVLEDAPGLELDYLELRAPDLGEPSRTGEARMLVAGRVGNTRLIDNTALQLGR